MGTDVYLSWDGMSDEEEKKRYTGYSIKAGNVGYLRASIGMIDENRVLRAIFPESFWNSQEEGGLPYDFKENADLIALILKSYIAGKDIDVGDRGKANEEFGKRLYAMIKGVANVDDVHMSSSNKEDVEFRVMWAKSVADFVALGIRLQKDKKNPKVDISW